MLTRREMALQTLTESYATTCTARVAVSRLKRERVAVPRLKRERVAVSRLKRERQEIGTRSVWLSLVQTCARDVLLESMGRDPLLKTKMPAKIL